MYTYTFNRKLDEQTKIEKMVNKKILSLQNDVQRDVLLGLAQKEIDRVAAEQELAKQKLMAKKSYGKSVSVAMTPLTQR